MSFVEFRGSSSLIFFSDYFLLTVSDFAQGCFGDLLVFLFFNRTVQVFFPRAYVWNTLKSHQRRLQSFKNVSGSVGLQILYA